MSTLEILYDAGWELAGLLLRVTYRAQQRRFTRCCTCVARARIACELEQPQFLTTPSTATTRHAAPMSTNTMFHDAGRELARLLLRLADCALNRLIVLPTKFACRTIRLKVYEVPLLAT